MLRLLYPNGALITELSADRLRSASSGSPTRALELVNESLPSSRRAFNLMADGRVIRGAADVPTTDGAPVVVLCRDTAMPSICEVAIDVTARAKVTELQADGIERRIVAAMERSGLVASATPEGAAKGGVPRALIELVSNLAKDKGAAVTEAMNTAAAEMQSIAAAATAAGNGGGGTGDDDDDIAAQVCSLVPQEAIDIFLEMGFEFNAVQRALLDHQLNHDAAANALLSGSVSSGDFGSADWRRYARMYLARPVVAGQKSTNPLLVRLMDMGFGERDARFALKGANGNFDEACSALLGDANAIARIKARQAEVEWIDRLEQDVRAGLVDPKCVVECVAEMLRDPQAILRLWHGPKHRTVEAMCRSFAVSAPEGDLSRAASELVFASNGAPGTAPATVSSSTASTSAASSRNLSPSSPS